MSYFLNPFNINTQVCVQAPMVLQTEAFRGVPVYLCNNFPASASLTFQQLPHCKCSASGQKPTRFGL